MEANSNREVILLIVSSRNKTHNDQILDKDKIILPILYYLRNFITKQFFQYRYNIYFIEINHLGYSRVSMENFFFGAHNIFQFYEFC